MNSHQHRCQTSETGTNFRRPSRPGSTAIELRSADLSPPPSGSARSAGRGMNSALQVHRNSLNSTAVRPGSPPNPHTRPRPPVKNSCSLVLHSFGFPLRRADFIRVGATLFCAAAFALGRAHADDGQSAFEQANRLYEQARFAEAAAAYEKIIQNGRVSPALYFNLGNALFKSGRIGLAIFNYRLAEIGRGSWRERGEISGG